MDNEDNALKIGQASASGSFKIFLGKVLSTLILAVGTIILGIFISDSAYGLYTIAVVPASTFLLFQDWGVNSALTMNCANYRAKNRLGDLRKLISTGVTFEASTGLILTLVSLLTANFISAIVFNNPESAFLIVMASAAILFNALSLTSQAVFVGFERMGLYSLVFIIQAIAMCAVAPLLVFLGYGAMGAVIGYTFSFTISGTIAVSLLYFKIYRKIDASGVSISSNFISTLKPLLSYGVPLGIGMILSGLLTQCTSLIMGSAVDLAIIGNYRIALNFSVLLTFFAFPVTTVLFPAFSKIDPKKEKATLKKVFVMSGKYAALLLVPATMIMMVLSTPLIETIYGIKYPVAPLFLSLAVITNLFSLFGNLSVNSFLAGVGETKMLMKLNAISIVIGLPLAFILIPLFGIFGVVAVSVIALLPNVLLSVYWTSKKYGLIVNLRNSLKILFSSSISALLTFIFISNTYLAYPLQLALGFLLFVILYLFSTSFIGAIDQSDVINMRSMFANLGFISKVLSVFLIIIEWNLDWRLVILQRLKG